MGARKTDSPVRTNTNVPVNRCSLNTHKTRRKEVTGTQQVQLLGGRMLLPDSQELRLLPRGTGLALHLQGVNVCDGDDGCCHVPWQTHEGAGCHQDAHPEQVQVVATTFLQSPR